MKRERLFGMCEKLNSDLMEQWKEQLIHDVKDGSYEFLNVINQNLLKAKKDGQVPYDRMKSLLEDIFGKKLVEGAIACDLASTLMYNLDHLENSDLKWHEDFDEEEIPPEDEDHQYPEEPTKEDYEKASDYIDY